MSERRVGYDEHELATARGRRTDPRIEAGAGSYEPRHRWLRNEQPSPRL